MNLMDYFRPKWRHSDPEMRVQAVKAMSDQTRLANIAVTDPEALVRMTAVEKVTDQWLLSRVALQDEDRTVRLFAFNRISSKPILAKFALDAKDDDFRLEAVVRIDDPAVRIKVALNDKAEKVCEAAVKEIQDPNTLAEILKKSNFATVRKAAIWNLNADRDQAILKEVIQNDALEEIRCLAVYRLKDQDALLKLARGSDLASIRAEATEKITDQQSLWDIFRHDDSEQVRIAAVKGIKDQNFLAEIVKTCDSHILRLTAIARIDDQKLLEEIAKEEKTLSALVTCYRRKLNNSELIEKVLAQLSAEGKLENIIVALAAVPPDEESSHRTASEKVVLGLLDRISRDWHLSGAARQAVPSLIALLGEGKMKARPIVALLGRIADQRAADVLIPFLDSKDDELQSDVEEALASIRDPGAVLPLAKLLVNRMGMYVRCPQSSYSKQIYQDKIYMTATSLGGCLSHTGDDQTELFRTISQGMESFNSREKQVCWIALAEGLKKSENNRFALQCYVEVVKQDPPGSVDNVSWSWVKEAFQISDPNIPAGKSSRQFLQTGTFLDLKQKLIAFGFPRRAKSTDDAASISEFIQELQAFIGHPGNKENTETL